MRTYEITFIKEKKVYQAQKGITLLEAMQEAGLVPDAFCGGQGSCGKCRVRIRNLSGGKIKEVVRAEFREALACQIRISRALEVETLFAEKGTQILLKGVQKDFGFHPGKLPGEGKEGFPEQPLLAAVDVGTTTLAVYLLDGLTGECLSVKSVLNPQIQYGADVVVRSSYALENGGESLSTCIREAVDGLLKEAAADCGRKKSEIVRVSMVGNSCMHHLFLGISTKTLALSPYEPKVKEALILPAFDYGLRIYPEGELLWLPNIGGFVGADTVACLLSSDLPEKEEMTLLIDIGTNGEMVLGNREGMTVCSTAAGPAFEGARITCGMRGSSGAIDHVWLEGEDLKYSVIGGGDPVGICGSGLLDAAACFLRTGRMDGTGWLSETYYFTPEVFLNQKDMRELQLAKAAISAGILLLCRNRGIRVDEIRRLLVAGAFGNYMNPDSACAVGMLPEILRNRIVVIGNAAGEGAQRAVLNDAEFERSRVLAAKAEFLELARDSEFQDIYVEALAFSKEREYDHNR